MRQYYKCLFTAVCAKHDAYVPREDVGTLEEIWPGAEVRYVDAGHVSAYILHQSLFRYTCIHRRRNMRTHTHTSISINTNTYSSAYTQHSHPSNTFSLIGPRPVI